MDSHQKIDSYLSKLPDWRGAKLSELREIINQAAPDSKEEFKWNCPVWSQNGLLLAISGFKSHVKINFFHGARFPDQSHFNNGFDSKDHRSIDYKEADQINSDIITKLVKTAIDLDLK